MIIVMDLTKNVYMNSKKADDPFISNSQAFIENNKEYLKEAKHIRISFNHTVKHNAKKKDFYKEIADVKILVLTANEIERETLFSCSVKHPNSLIESEEDIIIRIPYSGLVYSIFYINDIKIVHVEPEMTGSYSKGGTAETLQKALEHVRPSVVLSVGVAFGYDIEKQNLCDVLVGRQFFSYDKSIKMLDDQIKIKRLHTFESSENLLYKIKSNIMFEDKIIGLFNNTFNAHIGNILTGEYVIDSRVFRDLIFSPFKPFGIIGGEMEAFGMFNSIEEYNAKHQRNKVHGIMIKGICDWGAGKNADFINEKDKVTVTPNVGENDNGKANRENSGEEDKNNLQTFAMCNACTVCKMFLKENNFFSDYKIYGMRKFFQRCINRVRYFFENLF